MELTRFILLIMAMVAVFVSGDVTNQCPSRPQDDGWTIYIFRGKCYQFVDVERYWTEARDFCRGRGGVQVEIYDQETMDFVIDKLNNIGWDKNGVWAGAHDIDQEGSWQWTSGRDLSRYSNWMPGEPNNGGWLGGQDCVVMKRDEDWKWDDVHCSLFSWHYNFICMYDMVSSTGAPTTTTPTAVPPTARPSTTATAVPPTAKPSTTATAVTPSAKPSTTLTPTTRRTVPPTESTPSSDISTVSIPAVTNGEVWRCPARPRQDNWTIYTFRDKCYQYVDIETYWTEAGDYCSEREGLQLEIFDQATMDFTIDKLNNIGWNQTGVWTGAHDRGIEGTWTWTSGADLSQFSYWAPGQPSGSGWLNDPDCAVMWRDSGWRWDDITCYYYGWHYNFICMYNMTSEPSSFPTSTTPVASTVPKLTGKPGDDKTTLSTTTKAGSDGRAPGGKTDAQTAQRQSGNDNALYIGIGVFLGLLVVAVITASVVLLRFKPWRRFYFKNNDSNDVDAIISYDNNAYGDVTIKGTGVDQIDNTLPAQDDPTYVVGGEENHVSQPGAIEVIYDSNQAVFGANDVFHFGSKNDSGAEV